MEIEFKSICDWFEALCTHTCGDGRSLARDDVRGSNARNTLVGFTCRGCGKAFRISLIYVKCTPGPMRRYVGTSELRDVVATRMTDDPATVLAEMKASGGWFQPDPGVALMTLVAASMGPEGNPMEEHLYDMLKVRDVPKA